MLLFHNTFIPVHASFHRLQVYEVGPIPGDHSFRLIGELEIARHGYNFYVEVVELCDDGCLAFYFWSTVPKERRIVVWDFAKSLLSSLHWYPTASSWSSKPSQVSHSLCIVPVNDRTHTSPS